MAYQLLNEILDDVGHIRRRVDGHDDQFKEIGHRLAAMRSDDLRHEAAIAGLRADVDSIRHRLSLSDA